MKLQVGQTLVSAVDSTSVVVVRAPADELSVTCGGQEMAPKGTGAPAAGGPGDGGIQLGKRYVLDGVELELLCVKAGSHPVEVDGVALTLKTAKPLPASD
jgi:hypothetical protein